jgi:hypothetical protein
VAAVPTTAARATSGQAALPRLAGLEEHDSTVGGETRTSVGFRDYPGDSRRLFGVEPEPRLPAEAGTAASGVPFRYK